MPVATRRIFTDAVFCRVATGSRAATAPVYRDWIEKQHAR